MRFTDRTDHALRVLMFLASSRGRHTVCTMAKGFGVSSNHLNKAVQQLQGRGWVSTTRGRGGGVELAVDPRALRVGDVVREMEPSLALVECHRADGRCSLHGSCRLAEVLADLRSVFLGGLDRVTLAALVDGRESRLVRLVVSGKRSKGVGRE